MNLSKKVGPLPAWGWMLIVGGLLGAYVLYRKGKTGSTTGESLPELTGQALPSEASAGGVAGGAAGSLEASEAKSSAEAEALRQELSFIESQPFTSSASAYNPGGLGSGISEVLQAKEGLEALGLVAPASQTKAAAASAASSSPVKAATGKSGQGYPLSSSRGKYRNTTYKGKSAHEYLHSFHGGVGPKGNIVVVGGPSNAGHSESGSHAGTAGPTRATPRPATRAPAAPAGWFSGQHGYYRPTTYKGKAAHEYQHGFGGGVGPHGNLVIV